MQENRSFDSYFGTFPGADRIPHGVCVPDPMSGGCDAPFHDSADVNYGSFNTTITSTSFGQPIANSGNAYVPREGQLGVRVVF